MDSINSQQQEEHKKNLSGKEAAEKIKELADGKSGYFCTNLGVKGPITTRPMAVQKVDDEGNLWFLSANDSNKNDELKADPAVQMFFQGSTFSDFLTVYGTATVTQDKAVIDELWDPTVKNWFTEGKDDPRITAIKLTPESGYYWDVKHGNMVAFIKQMAGAITSHTMDDSIEGKINP